MSGISSTLNIAKGALAAQQYGLTVTGNNISNVNNPNYSVQNADQKSNTPALYSGFLFGTGVGVEQIRQRVDQLLENRLTDAKSSQAAFQEAESYLRVLEGYFDETSETGISNTMGQFWNSWQDLSNNPMGASERVAVYEIAKNLTELFVTTNNDLVRLRSDLNREIPTALGQVNSLTSQIAAMNREITGLELNRTAHAQRDQRNALVDELGELIDIDTFEQSSGAIIINVGNGYSLVNGVDSFELSFNDGQIMWQGSYGSQVDISSKITGGKLGGWLDIRDEVIPKYQSDLDVLVENMIWTMNYQHSQGAGLNFFSDSVVGDYRAEDSRLLSSYKFGSRIEHEREFKMWIRDQEGIEPAYRPVEVDMGISEASVSDWQGTAPSGIQARYRLTVVEGTTVGDTSTLYDETGWIQWEKLDEKGFFTGERGAVEISDEGRVEIKEAGVTTLSFNVSAGSLVAGNTLTVNTDEMGRVDPLDFRIRGRANSVSDMYTFTVESGGKVGRLPEYGEPPLVVRWSGGRGSGSFEIRGEDPPRTPETPVEVEVDGMTLVISDGTLFGGDVFTVTTDTAGRPVSFNDRGEPGGELLSDWHWTLDSFADQVNRKSSGIKASATLDNRLKFEASTDYHGVKNISFHQGGENFGFVVENTFVSVNNYDNVDFEVKDLTFSRSGSGEWTVQNDPTGGNITLVPSGGNDDGFGIDFNGDKIPDIKVNFRNSIAGEGSFSFDLVKTDASEMSFAFGDDQSTTAGVMAAAGINTFFSGRDSMTVGVNQKLSDSTFIAASTINGKTGKITQGDNGNALKLSDLQFKTIDMETWTYDRGKDARSSLTMSTLDGYYQMVIGSLGVKSRSVQVGRKFAEVMVTNLTEQRNSISAVSLDEEMINLMKYQHAFGAASKLVTVSDEMLNTLLGMR